MTHKRKESLEKFQLRVGRLDKPSLTSPLFSKVGWPLLVIGAVLWLMYKILPDPPFFIWLAGSFCIGGGIVLVVLSFITSHSEEVEKTERLRLIRERTEIARCLYLEGKVPDGRGDVGRCRLFEFDMIDHPYCLYCHEFSPSTGDPEV